MADLLLTLGALLLVPIGLLAGAALLTGSSLRRANRVAPSRSAAAPPLRWLWSPSSTAMLHRRLRSVCVLAGSVAGPARRARRWRKGPAVTDGIAELAREVVAEAVQLDRQVVSLGWLGRGLPRAQALAALDHQVRSVEEAARRVQQLADRRAQLARPAGPAALDLNQRIGAMEAALSELTPRPPLF